jgi:Bacterial PH domain
MNQQISETEAGLRRAMDHLQSVLIPGESLEAWAVQRRVFALKHRRLLVAATSGRLICIARKLIGGFDLRDLRWQDLEDVKLRVGIFSADLSVRTGRAADLASQGASANQLMEIAGLRKAPAEAVYRICQAQDQQWREKRRIRELEELRARAGGIQFSAGAAPAAAAPAAGASAGVSDTVRRLQDAKQMLDSKLITDSEYEAIKARIVSGS